METSRRQVCNGSFVSLRVDIKSQTRTKTAPLGLSVACLYGKWLLNTVVRGVRARSG